MAKNKIKNLLAPLSFDKSAIVDMKTLNKETKRDGRERGGLLCADLKGKITIQHKCKGDECSIFLYEKECKTGTQKQGTFHTHPKGNDISVTDIKISRDNNDRIQCLGIPDKKISCLIDKENTEDHHADVKREQPILNEMVDRADNVTRNIKLIMDYDKHYKERFLTRFNPEDYKK